MVIFENAACRLLNDVQRELLRGEQRSELPSSNIGPKSNTIIRRHEIYMFYKPIHRFHAKLNQMNLIAAGKSDE